MDATFWLVLVLGLLLMALFLSRKASGNNSLLERKVDLILKHLGLDPNQDVNPQVIEFMKAGQKIQAIKLYREQRGVGLKEAKDYVESLLERKVDLILKHLGIDPNQGVDEKIMELMRAGQKIEAIKLYRKQTGVGLKEAKDYVESL
jgi:ribosomal protein L7/L12